MSAKLAPQTRSALGVGRISVSIRASLRPSYSLSSAALTSSSFQRRTQPLSSRTRSSKLVISASETFSYSASELAGEGKPQTFSYRALSTALLAVGIACLADPTRALEVAYAATPSVLVAHLIRALGAVHILAAVAASCLSDAASHARLNSDTYKALNVALIIWSEASLAAFFTAPVAATKVAQAAYGILLGATIAIPTIAAQGFTVKLPKISVLPLFRSDKIYKAAAFSSIATALSVLLSTTGAISVPGVSWIKAPLGAGGQTMVQLLGAGSILSFFVLTILADAAQRRRLGASTFKALNRGVAVLAGVLSYLGFVAQNAGIIQVSTAVPASLGQITSRWPDALSTLSFVVIPAVGLLALYQAIFAKK